MKSEITAYIKEWKGGKSRLRIERQEYPRKSFEVLDEKIEWKSKHRVHWWMTTSGSEVNKDEFSDSTTFRSAAEVIDKEQKQGRLLTGSKNIDNLLGWGLEIRSITQIYGASNVGKTHLCHLLCVVLPLQFKSIYIDTERGFSGTRIKSIAQTRGLDSENIR